ncbi:helix-turn-helix transcriptional regulator [Agromyces salentinus]|uniref:LuxR family transcriptional regulator n=1 Tax=Agromyces salentinus TaxID=269421 RepID=A0ABP4YP21_9MICO|nr:LuxR family transcriptional regulator [Agromyces salentinus]
MQYTALGGRPVAVTDVAGTWEHEPVTTSAPAMIGRDADLAGLITRLDEVRSGAPFSVIIGGEAGIGKTRLVREFARRIGGEARVLVGQCVDLGTVAAPYAPVKAALRALVAEEGAERVLEAVGPGQAALLALLPELAASEVDGGSGRAHANGTPPRGDAASSQLHEAIAVLLETLSRERPIVFVIEDLHWIDAASLALLRFLMRALGSSRVLTVLTYRSEDVTRGHPVRAFLAEADRDRWVERHELGRLSHADAMAMIASLRPEAADAQHGVDAVVRRSDGVPFLIEELIGIDGCSDDSEVPETLRDLLLARYERLSEPTQRLLRLLSIGGVRVSHTMLQAVHEGAGFDIDEAAREAVLGGVLTVEGDDYAFRHALVREAIQADLLPGERARFHARYAVAYEAAAGGSRRLAAEISYHWLGANDAARAFPATIRAMAEARAAAAYASAAQLGERAIGLWQVVPDAEATAGMSKLELMGRTASHLRNAGEGERGLALIRAALDECPPDDPQYPRLLRDTGIYLANVGREGSIPFLEQALAALGDDGSEELRATVLIALAGRLMIESRLDEATAVAREALAAAERLGSTRFASTATNIQGISVANNGDVEAGLALLARAGELAADDPASQLRYLVNASDMQYLVGNFDEAVRLAEQGLGEARLRGVERSSGVILASNAVDPLLALGEWQRAEALTERALALDPPLPFTVYLNRARIWAMLWRGDVQRAAELYRAVRPGVARVMAAEMQTKLGVGRVGAELALALGDLPGAWHEVRQMLDDDRALPPGYALPFLWVGARVVAAVRGPAVTAGDELRGDVEAALPGMLDLLDRLSFWPTGPLWRAFFDAELATAGEATATPASEGVPGTDVAAWAEAVGLAELPNAPRYVGSYARLRKGEAELAVGDRAAARVTLNEAHGHAVAGGVTAVVERVLQVASAAGVPIDGVGGGNAVRIAASAREADAPTGIADSPTAEAVEVAAAVDELTARERQVLELIAEGLSNRQIGERLYISGKTASVHVSAILRKLGAATRTEAVYRAGALR